MSKVAVEKIRTWKANPVQFVRDVFHAEPDAWQVEALEAVRDNKRIAMSACKGPGKSCLLAWVIWWFVSTRIDAQVIAISITSSNLRDNLWKELAVWRQKSKWLDAAFDVSGERITSKERPLTWWVSARAFPQQADATQQANTLAGLHGESVLVVLDEVGDYPEGVVSAAEGIFANDVDARLVVAGNPTTTSGPLYRIVTKDAKRWATIRITGDPEDPRRSPRISKEWAQQQIDDWGRSNPWVMVNVLGLFPPSSSNTLIDANLVQLAMARDVSPLSYRADSILWGLDPARFGDDESVLGKRQGVLCRTMNTWRGLDGVELAGRVSKLILDAEEENAAPDALFIDCGGVGASVVDQLRLLGWGDLIRPVDFGSGADDVRFFNKRAEMWWRLSDWLKRTDAMLPSDPELAGQLTAPSFSYRVVGKKTAFVLESKDDMKKRGVGSPDRADALALTFAAAVAPKGKERAADHRRSARAVTDYDPFSEAQHGLA
jgi:hypothetical protein